jgi:hypothetical protein
MPAQLHFSGGPSCQCASGRLGLGHLERNPSGPTSHWITGAGTATAAKAVVVSRVPFRLPRFFREKQFRFSITKNTMSKNTAPTAKTTKAPAKTFRFGLIKAAIWANEADDKTYYSVTFVRSYQDEKKAWHDTTSFGRDDLPLLEKLASKAHEWIYETIAAAKTE